jgi:hypothetical protein
VNGAIRLHDKVEDSCMKTLQRDDQDFSTHAQRMTQCVAIRCYSFDKRALRRGNVNGKGSWVS